MGGLVTTNRVPAMHAEVSPGEAGSPSSFSRNNPRDMIEGTPSNTLRRTELESGEFQAKLPREPSLIKGTPSKMPRRTELKSRELQANDEENRVQEDCKSRELQANDKENRVQENCNT